MSSTSTIRSALETRLAAWAASQTPPLPIAFQSVSFTKPTDGTPYLECFLIPNVTKNHETSGTRKTLYGLFQVNVWTSGGTGMGTAEQLAEAIVTLFPLVPKFSNVSVESTPSIHATPPDASGWDITSVFIKYRYETFS